MAKISSSELQTVFNKALNKIMEGIDPEFVAKYDHYRVLSLESSQGFGDPEIESCSLFDDVSELKELAASINRPCTYVDIDRLASVLRAISAELNPAE